MSAPSEGTPETETETETLVDLAQYRAHQGMHQAASHQDLANEVHARLSPFNLPPMTTVVTRFEQRRRKHRRLTREWRYCACTTLLMIVFAAAMRTLDTGQYLLANAIALVALGAAVGLVFLGEHEITAGQRQMLRDVNRILQRELALMQAHDTRFLPFTVSAEMRNEHVLSVHVQYLGQEIEPSIDVGQMAAAAQGGDDGESE